MNQNNYEAELNALFGHDSNIHESIMFTERIKTKRVTHPPLKLSAMGGETV